jgi:hypothetical protein
MRPITRLIPIKATPIVIAALKALPGFAPMVKARIKMIVGRMIVEPKLLITV